MVTKLSTQPRRRQARTPARARSLNKARGLLALVLRRTLGLLRAPRRARRTTCRAVRLAPDANGQPLAATPSLKGRSRVRIVRRCKRPAGQRLRIPDPDKWGVWVRARLN